MSVLSYFYHFFCQPKVSPVITFEEIPQKQEEKKENLFLCLPNIQEEYLDSPYASPGIIPILPSLKDNMTLTSFQSSYDYIKLYTTIYNILLPYDPYFDHYEHYWLTINKKQKKHTSIKISLYDYEKNIIIVECTSMNKDNQFWEIYQLLKKSCNNVK